MLGYIISKNDIINVVEHEIQSFNVLHKTDLNIFVVENDKVLYKNYIIYHAVKYGHVQALEWFKRSGYEFKYDNWAINLAALNGHVQILEWFEHSGFEFKFDKQAIQGAAMDGHVKVLEWLKQSGHNFEYDTWTFYEAALYGFVQVLEWYKQSGYKFKYNNYYVIKAKNIIILKWFIENINPKKVIKWSKHENINFLRFKKKKQYFKGYEKN